jgi:hypothetical protein
MHQGVRWFAHTLERSAISATATLAAVVELVAEWPPRLEDIRSAAAGAPPGRSRPYASEPGCGNHRRPCRCQPAGRFHARLDQVLAQAGHSARANVASDQVLRRLLASEFPDLHLGNLNHCMYQEATAECRRLVRNPGIPGPLIDMCMPGRCSNSIITDQHTPIWEVEQLDLAQTLKQKTLAPGRRALIERRLAEVDAVLELRN